MASMAASLRRYVLWSVAAGLIAACGGAEVTATAPATPTPPATPAPTPTPADVLGEAAERMAALGSLAFALEHEEGRSPIMPGVEAERVEGVVALPDRASLRVDAIATALGMFVSLEIVIEGTEASMTDPLTGAPRRLEAASLPFDFLDLGVTLGDIVRRVEGPAFATVEEVDGSPGRWISGAVLGRDLTALIPSAVADATVRLEVWVGEDHLVRRVRIDGPVVAGDAPGVVRALTFRAFDEPVTVPPLP